jgi:hypothetical protein
MATIINSNTTWTSGSVVYLTEAIEVAENATLTIQPDVKIIGNGRLSPITVHGNLIAEGTNTSKIDFDNVNIGLGQNYKHLGKINLELVNYKDGVFLESNGYGSYNISNSTFENTIGFYIWYPKLDSEFIGNTFINTTGFNTLTSDANLTIKNNLFTQWQGDAIKSLADYNSSTFVLNNSFIQGESSSAALSLGLNYDSAGLIATNNYFGTTNAAVIDSLILDRSDSLSYASFISTSHTDTPDPLTPVYTGAPIVSTGTYSLRVIVDAGILGSGAVLLEDLTEVVSSENGVQKTHTLFYNDILFNYDDVDALITTVTRDGAFTDEFKSEIADVAPTAANITYSNLVGLVGISSVNTVLLHIAGADGHYVS